MFLLISVFLFFIQNHLETPNRTPRDEHRINHITRAQRLRLQPARVSR